MIGKWDGLPGYLLKKKDDRKKYVHSKVLHKLDRWTLASPIMIIRFIASVGGSGSI